MATFARGHWTRKTHTINEPLRKSLAGQQVQTSNGSIRWIISPVDMRGIPAIGRNCPGRIAGSRPDAIADREP